MKSLVALCALILGAQGALAKSADGGPFLSRTLKYKDGSQITCFILANGFKVTKSNGTTASFPLNLNAKELSKAIVEASRQPYIKTAIYRTSSDPKVIIRAGDLGANVDPFPLYAHDSARFQRSGKDALELIKEVRAICSSEK